MNATARYNVVNRAGATQDTVVKGVGTARDTVFFGVSLAQKKHESQIRNVRRAAFFILNDNRLCQCELLIYLKLIVESGQSNISHFTE